jgi:lipopolysaccharide assembly outer membrane protein LptD (OstA)
MKMVRWLLVVVGCCVLVAGASLIAQDKKPSNKEEVFIGGEGTKWKMRLADDKTVYMVTGNVVIRHGDTTVNAQQVEYTESKDKKVRAAVIDGGVKVTDPDGEITGLRATADLNQRKISIEGDVKLLVRPKPSARSSETVQSKLKEPATITCDKLDYLYRDKIATATGNLKIVQSNRLLQAGTAVYDAKSEIVTLTGGVTVTDEEGQKFTSSGIVKASLKDGDEWIEAENASATLKVDNEENSSGGKSP